MHDHVPKAKEPAATLRATVAGNLVEVSPAERVSQLFDRGTAALARGARPQVDHLLPLMVAVGAVEQDMTTRMYSRVDFALAVVSSYRFKGASGPCQSCPIATLSAPRTLAGRNLRMQTPEFLVDPPQ